MSTANVSNSAIGEGAPAPAAAATVPPWSRHWTHGATMIERRGRDEVSQLPNGLYVATLASDGLTFDHGPHMSLAEAHACCGNACVCFKPEVRAEQQRRRQEIMTSYRAQDTLAARA